MRLYFLLIVLAGLGLMACGSSEAINAGRVSANVLQELEILPERVCIISHFTENMRVFSQISVPNHQRYADRHGYRYRVFEGRISGPLFQDDGQTDPVRRHGLYWQKVTALRQTLEGQSGSNRCEWVMWVDADIIFTNFNIKITDLIKAYGYRELAGRLIEKSLIMPKDESRANREIVINNGAFFIKNNNWASQFISQMENAYRTYRNNGTPEQDAFQDYIYNRLRQGDWNENRSSTFLPYQDQDIIQDVAVVPQRVFDSFYRAPYFRDHSRAHWRKCDFIAHLSGVPGQARAEIMQDLIQEMDAHPCP